MICYVSPPNHKGSPGDHSLRNIDPNKPSKQRERKEFKPRSNHTHLSAAFSIDVDGRRRHHSEVFHLPCMRTVLKNPVIVPDARGEKMSLKQTWSLHRFLTQAHTSVLLQLTLGKNGRQRVSADFCLSLSVVRGRVPHALLIRVHLLHIVPSVNVQGDLGERAVLERAWESC